MQNKIEILNIENNLDAYLRKQKQKSIRIVTAFATNTEDLVRHLVHENRSVELLVGTINSFTDPTFIRAIAMDPGVSLFVDFRGAKSVHWKLALISPSTVIIGSANLTEIGLNLRRDTCVVIENSQLYSDYCAEISKLTQMKGVLSAQAETFQIAMASYQSKFDRMQAGRQFAEASVSRPISLSEWLEDEANETVKMFIWQYNHSEASKLKAQTIVKARAHSALDVAGVKSSTNTYRDFFVETATEDSPAFNVGDIVLCANKEGRHLSFFTFDLIERVKTGKNTREFMIALRRTRYQKLFDLLPYKLKISQLIREGQITGKRILTRPELLNLVDD